MDNNNENINDDKEKSEELKSEDKIFTQDDVNHIISERLSRFSEEKIEEKVAERLSVFEDERKNLLSEINTLKHEKEVNNIADKYKIDGQLLFDTGLSGEQLLAYAEKLSDTINKSTPVDSFSSDNINDDKINSFINSVFSPREIERTSDKLDFVKNFNINNGK